MKKETAQCESIGIPDSKMPEKLPEKLPDKIYRYELENLKRQLVRLEETVNTLTALCDVMAKNDGIKVDKFKGIVVITNI